MESHLCFSGFARLFLLIRPCQVFLSGLYDSYVAVSLIYKQLSLMQRQMTRCGILALMFVCAKLSMTSSKLVLFQMHAMMRKLQTVSGHFFPPLTRSHLLPRQRLKSTQGLILFSSCLSQRSKGTHAEVCMHADTFY